MHSQGISSDRTRKQRFDAIWEADYLPVLAFIGRRIGNPGEADEIAAQTFLTAWRRLDDVPFSSRPWLFAVARRVIANQHRGDRRRGALVNRLKATSTPEFANGDDATSARSERVIASFNELSTTDREALSLVVWEELKPREAARVVGVAPAAFSLRLHRAKRRLRNKLQSTSPKRSIETRADPEMEASR